MAVFTPSTENKVTIKTPKNEVSNKCTEPIYSTDTLTLVSLFTSSECTLNPGQDTVVPTEVLFEVPYGLKIAIFKGSCEFLEVKLMHPEIIPDNNIFKVDIPILAKNKSTEETVVLKEGQEFAQLLFFKHDGSTSANDKVILVFPKNC